MKILVTGGAGFLGSHLVDALVLGNDVTVIDDLSGGVIANLHPEVHSRGMFHQFDLAADGAHLVLADLFEREKFEIVYHLAAYAAECLSPFIKRFNYMNNVIGSVNLINAAVNAGTVKCFVFTSSAAVYGINTDNQSEGAECMPLDSYGVAKLAVERELKISSEIWKMPFVVFRPHNIFGPRQNLGDRYRNVIGIWMNQIMRGEPMTIFGDGLQTRCFTYVADNIGPLVAAPNTPRAINQTFNLGSDRPMKVLDLSRLVAAAMGKPEHPVKHLEGRHESFYVRPAHARLQDVFPPQNDATPIGEGLRQMANWARSVGPQEPSRFGAIEVEKNLPESWRKQ